MSPFDNENAAKHRANAVRSLLQTPAILVLETETWRVVGYLLDELRSLARRPSARQRTFEHLAEALRSAHLALLYRDNPQPLPQSADQLLDELRELERTSRELVDIDAIQQSLAIGIHDKICSCVQPLVKRRSVAPTQEIPRLLEELCVLAGAKTSSWAVLDIYAAALFDVFSNAKPGSDLANTVLAELRNVGLDCGVTERTAVLLSLALLRSRGGDHNARLETIGMLLEQLHNRAADAEFVRRNV